MQKIRYSISQKWVHPWHFCKYFIFLMERHRNYFAELSSGQLSHLMDDIIACNKSDDSPLSETRKSLMGEKSSNSKCMFQMCVSICYHAIFFKNIFTYKYASCVVFHLYFCVFISKVFLLNLLKQQWYKKKTSWINAYIKWNGGPKGIHSKCCDELRCAVQPSNWHMQFNQYFIPSTSPPK